MTDEGLSGRVRGTALALLARRAECATLCPSEVARAMAAAVGTADWRACMPQVHAEVGRMVAEGLVALSWRGAPRQVADGPYRIGRPHEEGAGPTRSQRLP